MREYTGVYSSAAEIKRVQQYCSRTLVQSLENKKTIQLTWVLVNAIDLNLDKAEGLLTIYQKKKEAHSSNNQSKAVFRH